jgi:predicted Fe-Mo cluster-binding NifX family protein
MKIAISSSDGSLNGSIFPVLGRCPFFTIVTTGDGSEMENDSLQNPGGQAGGGAGIAAAQAIIDSGAETVITGNCGPNALEVLLQAGIRIYSATGPIKDALKALAEGKLQEVKSPTAPGHFGMGFGRGQGPRRGFGGGRG